MIMTLVIPSERFHPSSVTFTSINESTEAERRHLLVRYDGQKCSLNTPPCAFPSGLIRHRGCTVLKICIADARLLRILQGLDKLLFEHVLANWDSLFKVRVVPDRASSLAQLFCPSVRHRGGGPPTLQVRVSARTKMLRAGGTMISAGEIDAGGVAITHRQGICGIELGLIHITSDRVAMSLHVDTIQFL